MKPECAVAAANLTKYYTDFWGRRRILAVDNLSLSISNGEIFGLLGPNGSGKTTFTKLLLGLLFPTAGEVRVLGGSPGSPAAKSRTGYLPEESSLHGFMNADETMHFHGRLYGLDKAAIRARSQELLAELDLLAARRRRVREYSKGMARRLGLACALLHKPDFLILDEPTSGLDPIGARKVKDMLIRLKKDGVTILLCSHLLSEVETVCDRIAIMEKGRLLKCGAVRELLVRPELLSILIRLAPSQVQERLREMLESSGAKVLEMTHPAMSLEELFLKTIGRPETPADRPQEIS
jgi:ABC-2 type transport system ATP-binding protein